MPRKSSVTTHHDAAGDYEVELFDHPNPKRVIVCSHGRGVRRWDGENFFYAVAEHYAESVVLLVDQNQHANNTVIMNPLPILIRRVNSLIEMAKQLHPETPICVMAHSMGCGVTTFLDLSNVNAVVLVTPGAGNPHEGYVKKYGVAIVDGKTVSNNEGAKVNFTAEFMASIKDISWENEYSKFVKNFSPVYAFEAGEDGILGDERFVLRDIPFTRYEIIAGAKHNLTGQALAEFFTQLDPLI